MAKRLTEAEWAKVRHDREVKGLSFHELASKYDVSSATVYRRSKAHNWSEPDAEVSNPTEGDNTDDSEDEVKETRAERLKRKRTELKNRPKIKPDCFSDDEPSPVDETKRNETNETKRNAENETKRNETPNETDENSKEFDVQGYVDSLKKTFDPTRARDRDYMSFQLESIDAHLGELSDVYRGGTDDHGNNKYHPAFARIAYHIALLGGTPTSLAKTLNVSEQTVHNWLHRYPEFNIAWVGGKDFADAKVAQALFKRAVGFQQTVEDYKTERGELVPIEKTVIFPPDVNAQIFWLKNRQAENWKEKVEVQEQVQIAVIDHEAANARYVEILDTAQQLKNKMNGRMERMGLTLDGDVGEGE